jgi:very-short-patch-repair endonuclease
MGKQPEKAHNLPHKKEERRELRNNLTSAEAALWLYLQRSQLEGRKFRRQHSIGLYIVDFYCPSEKLVVELDGAGHFDVIGNARDVDRTHYLEAQGLQVLRFENQHFWNHPESVLTAIRTVFLRNTFENCSSGINHP